MHLAWRYFAYQRVRAEPRFQPVFRDACKRSALFYMNTFVWVHEPRRVPSTLPMATWDFQDDLVKKIVSNIRDSAHSVEPGKIYDIIVEKTRAMAVTWTALVCLDWFWRFFPGCDFLAISEKELKVDRIGDMSALFPKLDFVEERLPTFLQVRGIRHDQYHGRRHLVVSNTGNGSSITGESANADAGRSGRYLAVLRDEEGAAPWGEKITESLIPATKCQLRVSTARGTGNSFYAARKAALAAPAGRGVDLLTLHWSKHPEYARGLYEWNGQDIRVLDPDWHAAYSANYNRKYPFRREPTYSDPGAPWEFLRSPWFDAECDRAKENPRFISQELQISYLGSGSPFFSAVKLSELRKKYARPCQWQGFLESLLNEEVVDADVRPDRCKCWFQVVAGRPPQKTTYTLACDIGTGTGVSDSSISVGDDRLKTKVFEFYSNGILPEQFAVVVKQVAGFFTTAEGKPFVAWDAGGPGQSFGARFLQLETALPVYWHKAAGTQKRARLPGVQFSGMGGKPKLDLFTAFRTALFGTWYVTPSVTLYEQAAEYVYSTDRGLPEHVAAVKSEEAEGRGEQHGDVVCSEVVLFEAMQNRPQPVPAKPEIPVGSLAWRRQEAAAEAKAATAWCGWN